MVRSGLATCDVCIYNLARGVNVWETFLQKISRPWKTPHAKIAKFGIQRYHFTMLVQRLDSQIPPDLRLKCGNQSKKALHEAEQEIMQLASYSVLTHRVQWFSIFIVHVDAKQYECLQSKYKGKFFIGISAIFHRRINVYYPRRQWEC